LQKIRRPETLATSPPPKKKERKGKRKRKKASNVCIHSPEHMPTSHVTTDISFWFWLLNLHFGSKVPFGHSELDKNALREYTMTAISPNAVICGGKCLENDKT
jgi:hypothetical protein